MCCEGTVIELMFPEDGVNLLKPTGHVMHHQFNIQQLYALPTLYLCVLYLSENKQRFVPITAQTDCFLFCTVNTHMFRLFFSKNIIKFYS